MYASSKVYVADAWEGAVVCFDTGTKAAADGYSTVVAGGNGTGSRLDQLDFPCGVAVESDGSVIVADQNNHRCVRWRRGAKQGEIVAGHGEHSRVRLLFQVGGIATVTADFGSSNLAATNSLRQCI